MYDLQLQREHKDKLLERMNVGVLRNRASFRRTSAIQRPAPSLGFRVRQHRFVFPPGYVHVILLHLAEKLSLSGKQQLQLFAPGCLSCFVVILHIIPVLYESPNLGLGNRPAKRKSGGGGVRIFLWDPFFGKLAGAQDHKCACPVALFLLTVVSPFVPADLIRPEVHFRAFAFQNKVVIQFCSFYTTPIES
ncbi:hypothetical protein WMY93_033146 [Mugilogobius chulae]|uniref:Uncharacterized protein n=1 Tax=Mugilogobius chulae TaxID=88201 RepID=A0AAW0MJD4_9GOBI